VGDSTNIVVAGLHITRCAGNSGSAISVEESTVTLDRVWLTHCASSNGAIAVSVAGNYGTGLTVRHSLFAHNSGSEVADAAVDCEWSNQNPVRPGPPPPPPYLDLQYSTFLNNSGPLRRLAISGMTVGGGAVQSTSCHVRVSGCAFLGNSGTSGLRLLSAVCVCACPDV
jgi:hypothetical protein